MYFVAWKKKPGYLASRTDFTGHRDSPPLNPKIRDCPRGSGTNMIPLRCFRFSRTYYDCLRHWQVLHIATVYTILSPFGHHDCTVWPYLQYAEPFKWIYVKFNNFLQNTFIFQLMPRHASGLTVAHLYGAFISFCNLRFYLYVINYPDEGCW